MEKMPYRVEMDTPLNHCILLYFPFYVLRITFYAISLPTEDYRQSCHDSTNPQFPQYNLLQIRRPAKTLHKGQKSSFSRRSCISPLFCLSTSVSICLLSLARLPCHTSIVLHHHQTLKC